MPRTKGARDLTPRKPRNADLPPRGMSSVERFEWYIERATIGPVFPADQVRFPEQEVIVGTECIDWPEGYSVNRPGYPILNRGQDALGDEIGNTTAIRWSLRIATGKPLPADRPHVDHLCRRITCVNPLHLESVTAQENTDRAMLYREAS